MPRLEALAKQRPPRADDAASYEFTSSGGGGGGDDGDLHEVIELLAREFAEKWWFRSVRRSFGTRARPSST
jgi:hypothetical protein